eukprot:81454-Rhodomonas_salina.1
MVLKSFAPKVEQRERGLTAWDALLEEDGAESWTIFIGPPPGLVLGILFLPSKASAQIDHTWTSASGETQGLSDSITSTSEVRLWRAEAAAAWLEGSECRRAAAQGSTVASHGI